MGIEPKDWDITTNATPEQIQSLFEKTVYENEFGTVAVIFENEPSDSTVRSIEVTPYRTEEKYSNNRHPDAVSFSEHLEDDLQRRDFTMNTIAISVGESIKDIDESLKRHSVDIKDIYKGQAAIAQKEIIAVGNAKDRFTEDALRILRAVRFSAQLGFTCNTEILEAIGETRDLLKNISKERIRDEFVKIVNSSRPMVGIELLNRLGILEYVVPELLEMKGVIQGGEHVYDVWEHSLRALQNGADKEYPNYVRLASLFHDIGKPRTARPTDKKGAGGNTFYGHEVVGAKMTKKIMQELKFSNDLIDQVVKLVRWHMFFSDPEAITLSAVRRLMVNVGPELVWDLMKVRRCDRIGMGRPNEAPYRLRKFEAMIEEASRDPISVKQLKIDGEYLIKEMNMKPGPRMGWTLHALLEVVLENPEKNTIEDLTEKVKELDNLNDEELKTLGEAGKSARDEADEKEIEELNKKHGVK
jgi:poly(A) polymerase/tRNA nucleotidyltransferase (CCA-adding enzyme)